MTLFANAGVAWPQQQPVTSSAGAKTMAATSMVFRALAGIEQSTAGPVPYPPPLPYPYPYPYPYPEPPGYPQEELQRAAELLKYAASEYGNVAEQLKDRLVPGMSPSELELAAVRRGRNYIDERFEDLFENRRSISVGELYNELAHRVDRMASALASLDTQRNPTDIAPQVFQLMWMLEAIMTLARVIATLGRRRPSAGF